VNCASDKQNPSEVQQHNQKDMNDVETMSSRTKNIFMDLIGSDNGATNILQNFNFIKCTSSNSSNNLNNANATNAVSTSTATVNSSSNGTCKQQKVNNHNGDDNNNQLTTNLLHPTTNETNGMQICISNNNTSNGSTSANSLSKKRHSVTRLNGNGDLSIQRELSPSPRVHRKSSHDIRLLRNNHMQDGGGGDNPDVAKCPAIVRPLKTKNIITRNETFDTLHSRAMEVST
jgi:hypothetical protein